MKRIFLGVCLLAICLLSGCKEVQIFEKPAPDHAVEISGSEMKMEVYYVKNGTKFSEVYMPTGTAKGSTTSLNKGRVIYFYGDEAMIPVHYKGELVAYASAKADLKQVILERFMDMGYSIGIFGGELGDDGYYHISTGKNVCPNSDADDIFSQVVSDEVRIVSVAGVPIKDLIDEGSGIIKGLSEGKKYLVEFYSGTYYYRENFTADMHFLRAFEVYRYNEERIEDTINGYMCFNTPEDLKSGYYNVNGKGLFLYHAYKRGEKAEYETLNEGFYENAVQMVAAYSKQYTISVPYDTKDMIITANYGKILNELDAGTDILGYVVAPDGTGYEMVNNEKEDTLTLSLTLAMAGNWEVYISPKSLDITDMTVKNDEISEDTVCEESEFLVPEDTAYQMFYADVEGSGSVYGSIIAEDGVTYNFSLGEYKDGNRKGAKYLYYRMPYVPAGTYTVRIYHYQSQTTISNIQMVAYDDMNSDIIIIE
jgi:hypothetical protein